jgi:hypothetical protein
MSAVEHPAGAPSLKMTNVHFDIGYVVASGTANECQIEACGQHRCKNSWSGESTGRFWPLADRGGRCICPVLEAKQTLAPVALPGLAHRLCGQRVIWDNCVAKPCIAYRAPMRKLVGFVFILLVCAAYWFFEQPRTLAQAHTEISDANGNPAVRR